MNPTTLAPHSRKTMPMAISLIAAGEAVEIAEDSRRLDVNEMITGGREGFAAFEITGNSDAPHILPGYVVFVDTWAEPRNGSFIAAEVNGLNCVKKFVRSTRGLYLVSRNTDYPPREITPQDAFRVLGVVKGHLAVYRS